MGTWRIAKEFEFCYGHRVWAQKLNPEFSLTNQCKCRHLHGHQGKIIVYLEANMLNEQGMVVDFVNLNWFKQFIDDNLDHKFIIDRSDPLLAKLVQDGEAMIATTSQFGKVVVRPGCTLPDAVREMYEGMVVVNFVPTSENLAAWLYGIVQQKMSEINVSVHSIQFYETPKSQSTYTRDEHIVQPVWPVFDGPDPLNISEPQPEDPNRIKRERDWPPPPPETNTATC